VDLVILPDQWGHLIESAIPCLANTPGEIAVAGDHVLTGYLHGKGDEETKFQSAGRTWHRTGDAGYLDEQGRLWLLGRCSAKIEDTRGTLYPFTVETSLSFMPEIARSAAIECSPWNLPTRTPKISVPSKKPWPGHPSMISKCKPPSPWTAAIMRR
jgi:acyl-CoA synthetase (AMP-forming)/AMP-acid ligase II